ncbi:MAG: hypothetical protein ACRBG0_19495 [Lewinella sp.]|uniref:hypothetical protein n=1 Tax=Lewinella sp. TaxID=2004506 RepID=UPI003D6B0741
MKSIFFYTSIILANVIVVNLIGQNMESPKGLLNGIRSELFSEAGKESEIHALLGCEEMRISQNQTFTYKIPNPKKVQQLFIQLISNPLSSQEFNELIDIYDEYENVFRNNWEQLFHDNLYPCEIANQQYQYLEMFEETIHSVAFRNMNLSPGAQLSYYLEYLGNHHQYFMRRGEWAAAIRDRKIHSPYFRYLKENRLDGQPFGGFQFIDPFIESMGYLLIENQKDGLKDGEYFVPSRDERYYFLRETFRLIGRVGSLQQKKLLIEVFIQAGDELTSSMIYNHFLNIAYYLTDEETNELKSFIWERYVTSVDDNRRLTGLTIMIYFPSDGVVDQLLELTNKVELHTRDLELIRVNLNQFLRQPEISETTKELIRQALN